MSIYVARPALMHDNQFNFREVYAVEAFRGDNYVQYAGIQTMRLEPGKVVMNLPANINAHNSKLTIE